LGGAVAPVLVVNEATASRDDGPADERVELEREDATTILGVAAAGDSMLRRDCDEDGTVGLGVAGEARVRRAGTEATKVTSVGTATTTTRASGMGISSKPSGHEDDQEADGPNFGECYENRHAA